MEDSLARPLNTMVLVRDFLQKVLQLEYSPSENIEQKIVDGELGVTAATQYNNDFNTYDKVDFRHSDYSAENARWALRKRIVEELLQKKRLESDDKIELGTGGACPTTIIQPNSEVFLITGLPASGKSGIANTIADHHGAIIVDSDYAKRKLPEYWSHSYGASLVNKESSKIVSTFTEKPARFNSILSVQELAISKSYNIVLPKIGNSLESLIKLAETYKSVKYKVHLTLVNLDRKKATKRAMRIQVSS